VHVLPRRHHGRLLGRRRRWGGQQLRLERRQLGRVQQRQRVEHVEQLGRLLELRQQQLERFEQQRLGEQLREHLEQLGLEQRQLQREQLGKLQRVEQRKLQRQQLGELERLRQRGRLDLRLGVHHERGLHRRHVQPVPDDHDDDDLHQDVHDGRRLPEPPDERVLQHEGLLQVVAIAARV
jgi:hypothetical protein